MTGVVRKPFVLLLLVCLPLGMTGCGTSDSPPVHIDAPPIIQAAQLGDLNAVKQIIKTDPEQMWTTGRNGGTAADWGILNNFTEVTYHLIDQGYLGGEDSNERANELMFSAISRYTRESDEMLAYLLKHGADPNAKWEDLDTYPLHVVINNRMTNKIRLLAEHGADFSLENGEGRTPREEEEYRLQQYQDPAVQPDDDAPHDPDWRQKGIDESQRILDLLDELIKAEEEEKKAQVRQS